MNVLSSNLRANRRLPSFCSLIGPQMTGDKNSKNRLVVEVSDSTRAKLLFLGAVLSFSSIYQMGTSNAYVNTATDTFRDYLSDSLAWRGVEMSERMYTWMWSVVLNSWFPGFALGSCVAIPIADLFGRKYCLLTGNAATLFTIVLMTIGIHWQIIELFFFGRFLSAVSSAVTMNALILFLQEISPLNMRGTLSFFAEMSFVMTNAVGMVFGMQTLFGSNLEFLTGSALVPALISVIIVFPLHETPKFLLLKRKDETRSKQAIRFYLNLNETIIQALMRGLHEVARGETGTAKCLDAFRIPHIRLGLLLGIFALQITTSLWPVIFYSVEFLRRANVSASLAEFISSLMLILSTISTFCGLMLVEKFSRREIFIGSSLLNIACLSAFVVFSQLQKWSDLLKYACCLALIGHSVSYSFALGPIAWFITAELVPIEYRCVCQSIALAFNQLMSFALTLVVMPLYNEIDSYALVPLFILPPIVALIALCAWLPETKGRDILQVVDDLQRVCGTRRIQPSGELSQMSPNQRRNEYRRVLNPTNYPSEKDSIIEYVPMKKLSLVRSDDEKAAANDLNETNEETNAIRGLNEVRVTNDDAVMKETNNGDETKDVEKKAEDTSADETRGHVIYAMDTSDEDESVV